MGEWRKLLDSEEVKELVQTMRPQLYERFAEIVARAKSDPPVKKGVKAEKGPAKAKGPAPKANEKQNKKGARALCMLSCSPDTCMLSCSPDTRALCVTRACSLRHTCMLCASHVHALRVTRVSCLRALCSLSGGGGCGARWPRSSGSRL